MRMPFGKYKEKEIHHIATGYLSWLLANCELSIDLRTAVEYGLKKKRYDPVDTEALIEQIVKPYEGVE